MRKGILLLLMIVDVVFLAGNVHAATYYVPDNFATIQNAIDAAQPGDKIVIQAGAYNESVVMKDGITLSGESAGSVTLTSNDWYVIYAKDVPHATVENITFQRDGGYSWYPFSSTVAAYMEYSGIDFRNITVRGFSSGLYYTGTSPAGNPVIEKSTFDMNGSGISLIGSANATIRNNSFTNTAGSGVNMYYSSSPEITDNRFEGNGYATYAFESCSPLISGNTMIRNNYGMSYAWSSHGTITKNFISQNNWTGIWAVTYSSPRIDNNIVTKNGRDGLWMFINWPTITNNTIVGNTTDGVGNSYYSSVTLRNNIIAFNGGLGVKTSSFFSPTPSWMRLFYNDVFGNVQGDIDPHAWVYEGNISADPMFKDRVNEDYKLSSGSPCINAGDPNPAYNDLDGSRNDMGAFGGQNPYPSDDLQKLTADLKGKIIILPDSAFKNEQAGRKEIFEKKLDVVIEMMEKGNAASGVEAKRGFYLGALNKLTSDLLAKCDGHFGGNPENDWIVTYEAQSTVYPIIVDLMSIIQTMMNALG